MAEVNVVDDVFYVSNDELVFVNGFDPILKEVDITTHDYGNNRDTHIKSNSSSLLRDSIFSMAEYKDEDRNLPRFKVTSTPRYDIVCSKCNINFKKIEELKCHMVKCGIRVKVKNNEEKNRNLQLTTNEHNNYSRTRLLFQENPLPCLICSKIFKKLKSLENHLKEAHQPIQISSSDVINNGITSLDLPLKELESPLNMLTCSHCPKKFKDQKDLDAHKIGVHLRAKTFTCSICKSRFPTLLLQQDHQRSVHIKEFPYYCISCSKVFKDIGTLTKHQATHITKTSYSCPLCTEQNLKIIDLQRHLRIHMFYMESNNCPDCKSNIFSVDVLCSHLEKHVDDNTDPMDEGVCKTGSKEKPEDNLNLKQAELDLSGLTTLCDVAISSFDANLYSSSNHIVENNEYCCLFCGMHYLQKGALNFHLASIHFVCSTCNTRHVDKKALNEHVCNITYLPKKISQMEKAKQNFTCKMCTKSFSSRNGFTIHQRSHTGERPFQCRFCKKAFVDSTTRLKHERIHTGERPFKCSNCFQTFNQRAALRAHETTSKCQRPFQCPYCPTSFSYITSLQKHTEAQHSDLL